jgi:hypothetical protein
MRSAPWRGWRAPAWSPTRGDGPASASSRSNASSCSRPTWCGSGMQGAAARTIAGDPSTTYMTGALTALVEALSTGRARGVECRPWWGMRQSKCPILGTEPKHLAGSPARAFGQLHSGAQPGLRCPTPPVQHRNPVRGPRSGLLRMPARGRPPGPPGRQARRPRLLPGRPVRGGTGRRDDQSGTLIFAGGQAFNDGGMPGAMPP